MSFDHNKNKSDQRIAPDNNNHGLSTSPPFIGSSRSNLNINNTDPESSFSNRNPNIYSGDSTLDNNNNNNNKTINQTENTNLVNSIPPTTLPHTLDLLTKASPHNPRFSLLRSSPFLDDSSDTISFASQNVRSISNRTKFESILK